MALLPLLEQIINGLVIGVFYALSALGLAIIFGVLRIVNFAHGELYMLGGFAYYVLVDWLGVPPILGVPLAAAALFVTGMAIEAVLIRPIYQGKVERPDEYAIMITFGLALFLQNLALAVFGPWTNRVDAVLQGRVIIGELIISGNRIAASVIGLILIAVTIFVLHKTWVGKAVRAVSQDRETAAIVGINVERASMMAFGRSAWLSFSACCAS